MAVSRGAPPGTRTMKHRHKARGRHLQARNQKASLAARAEAHVRPSAPAPLPAILAPVSVEVDMDRARPGRADALGRMAEFRYSIPFSLEKLLAGMSGAAEDVSPRYAVESWCSVNVRGRWASVSVPGGDLHLCLDDGGAALTFNSYFGKKPFSPSQSNVAAPCSAPAPGMR